MKFYIDFAYSEDPQYAHIEAEERQKLMEQANEVDMWMQDVFAKQKEIPTTQDPHV
eukprot:CAMPEP_0201282626 /NCGR_PEP_ID=MMETSP1317-20130820/6184_1 /ASSEMBLY_ACC=CAM_ASM_000770 /TAXON_ID=187299 /ORGANISM="Undescribed Undescribed, Strain Undescribed" /LENGTH=55 /DNA_ID=CAMNT_0047595921 /DNA_START=2099 /DNA_END=2266 /DNA_ORIENTATION=+